ncbi:MAG: nucleotidyltransferase family protein [Nanoarchaeales archaeon]|nr:nucleotidyltransferase family protein [Nanoarchaeales archaeon]
MNNLTKELILENISINSNKIKKFGVNKLTLFGSFARNEQTENSDIDFLVDFDDTRGLFDDYMGLSLYLEKLFNKKVDLVKPHLVREELKSYIFDGVLHETRI